MDKFLQALINGINLGSVYAIIALGYSMVYGIAKMLNFAHGDVIMVGAFTSFLVVRDWGMDPLASVIVSVIICTILGVVIEGLAYKPLRKATSLSVLITAIGVSYFLQNMALLLWGSDTKQFTPIVDLPNINISESVVISGTTIVTVVVSVLIMVFLTWFTGKTKTGCAMRAVSEDKGAAQLMGINVNRTISITFAIGSALAAIAGVLMCSSYSNLMPTTGALPGIKAFTAAVLGGIGSIPGAMLGGILLGLVEILSKTYLPPMLSQLSDAIVFGVLIVILLVKPAGLLGKQVQEKV